MDINTCVNFKNEHYGCLEKNRFTILSTNDGGITWEEESLQYSITEIIDIAFLNDHKSILLTTDKLFIKDDRITSLTELKPNSFSIYPNPLPQSKTLNMAFNTDKVHNNLEISIIDFSGKVIDEHAILGCSVTIQYEPEGKLVPGAYLIVIEADSEVMASEKFVIE